MSKVRFSDGTTINFGDHTPTPAEIEEAYGQVKGNQQSAPQEPRFSLARGARQAATGYAGGFSGGLTDILANKAGVPQSTLRNIGGVAGMLTPTGIPARAVGLVERGAARFAPHLVESFLGRLALSGAKGAAGAGATGIGESVEQGNVSPALGRAAFGGAVGAGGEAVIPPAQAFVRGLKSVGLTTEKGFPKFGNEVRQAYHQVGSTLREKFAPAMQAMEQKFPNQAVNLRNVVERIRTLTNPESESYNPALSRRIDSAVKRAFPKGDVTLANLIENPELADKTTLTQSQQLISSLKSVPSLPGKLAKQGSSYTDVDLDLLDLANEARASQLKAFPEFKEELENYHEVNDALRKIKKFFSESRLEPSVKKSFGTSEEEALVQKYIPKNIYEAIRDVRRGNLIKKGALGLAVVGVGGGIAGEIGRKILRRE